MKLTMWDYSFLFAITVFLLIFLSLVNFYMTHQCPEGMDGVFIGDYEWVCINNTFRGGEDYRFSRSIEGN